MTTPHNPQAKFTEILQRRFPDAAFTVSPSASGSGLSITWDSPPDNRLVATYLREAGLSAETTPDVPGFVRVSQPKKRTTTSKKSSRTKHPSPQYPSRRSASHPAPRSFGAQGLWSIADLEVIRITADRWVSSLHNPGPIAYYAGGMSLLLIASGYLAWVLDIRPSLLFGQHLAAELASEWLNMRLLTAVIFLLSITPNLLEFFATGLAAHGNVIVDLSIKVALLFDAATDAPMAYAIAKAIVGFFFSEPDAWSGLLSVLLAIPVLLLSTIMVEILFLSFLTAFISLLQRSWAVRKSSKHYVR